MDISGWDSSDFVYLVRLLLQAEGNQSVQTDARAHDVGIDLTVNDPSMNGEKAIVQCKLTNKTHSISEIMEIAENVARARDYLQAELAYFITSGQVKPEDLEYVDDHADIILWERSTIESLLAKHTDARVAFEKYIGETQLTGRLVLNADPTASRAKNLATRLKNLPPGREHWREYEDLCIEILTFLFFPDLGTPSIQSKSEDGLDRRDAIYPINQKQGYWHVLRLEFASRFVVAEFKNYSEEIAQKEVESIKEYLHDVAFRTFGILCSRRPASDSAIAARRRAWIERKRIVMVSDTEILEMLDLKAKHKDPTDVLERLIQAFLIRLTP